MKISTLLTAVIITAITSTSAGELRPRRIFRPASDPATPAAGQAMEVDAAEVFRCGDQCHLITGHEATIQGAVSEAMAPPANDGDKFYVSIVRQPNDPACERLLDDWATDSNLRSLAMPGDLRSWSHCTVYTAGDESQDWRFSAIEITGYPTVLITPPRSGIYGDAATVIYQADGYDGDGRAMAADMSAAIRRYVGLYAAHQGLQAEAEAPPPPWDTPAEDGERRRPQLERIPRIPPAERPGFRLIPWSLIFTGLTGFSLPVLVGAGIWLLARIRAARKAAGSEMILSDDQMARLVALLETIGADEDENKPERRPPGRPRKKRRATS